jgi:DNA polymerase-4
MSDANRRIAHLDMDAFFASVELLRRPELRGQPVVVGGRRATRMPLRDYAGRGVVTTATYEARGFGVHSGMGIMRAANLAPDAILLPADFEAYRHYSRLFKQAVREIAPRVEDRGIDEIYIDLSDLDDTSSALGARLKHAVRAATGLTCSIGIAPNKLLAKLGSELDKPDGLTILRASDIPARIWPLPVNRINGVGPKATARLAALGIGTIAELATAAPPALIAAFGASYGAWLHEVAHGRDGRPLVTRTEPKSISRETTFERDLHPRHDRPVLTTLLTELCARVAADLVRKGYAGRTIGIKLRYDDFRTITRDLTLPDPVSSAAALRQAAGQCLRRVPLERRLRLLGVRVSGLVRADADALEVRSPQALLELEFSPGTGGADNR